jgi:predicted Zn-dependent peptidase
MVWAMPDRLSPDYYSIDLLSDILGNGDSSRLLQKLLKQERLFSEIDAYISGTLDAGLFIIEAKPSVGISLEVAENAIWAELQLLKKNLIGADELQKVKNKTFSNLLFSEMGVLNKAMNLGFFALLGNTELINLEYSFYENVSVEDIQKQANNIFSTENANVLYYEPFDFNTV